MNPYLPYDFEEGSRFSILRNPALVDTKNRPLVLLLGEASQDSSTDPTSQVRTRKRK